MLQTSSTMRLPRVIDYDKISYNWPHTCRFWHGLVASPRSKATSSAYLGERVLRNNVVLVLFKDAWSVQSRFCGSWI